jgi:hypothetical protein
MDHLLLRKVQHPQAANNYRVILKTEYDGEFEIGSIGVQTFTSSDTAWTWGLIQSYRCGTIGPKVEAPTAAIAWSSGPVPEGMGSSLQAAGLAG